MYNNLNSYVEPKSRFCTLVRLSCDAVVSNAAATCIICHKSFQLSSAYLQHLLSCINRINPQSLLKAQQFQVTLFGIYNFISRLTLCNKSSKSLVLRSAYIVGRNGAFISLCRDKLRIAPGYCYEKEINFKSIAITNDSKLDSETVFSNASVHDFDWNFVLFMIAVPAIVEFDGYEIVEMHFLKACQKRTPLVLKELPEHEVSTHVAKLYEKKFDKHAALGSGESEILSLVKKSRQMSSLTKTNYKTQLCTLNQIEDIHLQQEFSKYTITNPTLKHNRDLYYTISTKQFAKQSLEIKKDMQVCVTIMNRKQDIFGTVDELESTVLYLLMNQEIRTEHVTQIRFSDDRTTFKMEYEALKMMDPEVIARLMFPEKPILNGKVLKHSSFQWLRQSINSNEEQMTAVRNIVNRTSFPAPYILIGPPGTGKTSTLVEAIAQIYQLCPDKNILVVATSNFAANELTDRLLDFVPSVNIFRFFAKTAFRQIKEIKPRVLQTSNFRDRKNKEACCEDIYDNRIVICTLATAGRLVQASIPTGRFSYIFIDECGSAKEISALVPIINLGTCGNAIKASVILAGDPRQLGPVIQYEFLNPTTHSISMLERMSELECYKKDPATGEYNHLLITQLRNNYRSHESLLHFANHAFYAGQLRAKASPVQTDWAIGWHRLPNRKFPMIFHPICGKVETVDSSTSLYNPTEIDQIVFYVQDILQNGVNKIVVKQSQIGIISPYARQVIEIKRKVFGEFKWSDIEVGSTEQYQGREKDIIILSTVRSNCKHVGFLANEKRLNVTVTRARALMIIVGDIATLQRNRRWNELIRYCRKNNAIVRTKPQSKEGRQIPAGNENMPPKCLSSTFDPMRTQQQSMESKQKLAAQNMPPQPLKRTFDPIWTNQQSIESALDRMRAEQRLMELEQKKHQENIVRMRAAHRLMELERNMRQEKYFENLRKSEDAPSGNSKLWLLAIPVLYLIYRYFKN